MDGSALSLQQAVQNMAKRLPPDVQNSSDRTVASVSFVSREM